MYSFMQPVTTPRGPGFYIHAFVDGVHCQVAIRERGIQKNPIFRLDEISAAANTKTARSAHREPEPVLQVVEAH
jgi:hypothetical protein